ncbi:MAG: TetR/AcrR family transcriptional regulator [Candidatus Thorarchaeota archaeon]|nr:TetR/AcrR family transcriptional regulator [Candidatus Thorarchaeota archaeon]
MNSQSRKRRTKKENMDIIKRVAFQLLKEKGYVNLSINDIADMSSINISQVYRYFPNGKPDIFLSLGVDFFETSAPKLESIDLNRPREFLYSLVMSLINTHRANRLILQVLKIVFLSYPELLKGDKDLFRLSLSEFKYFDTLVEQLGVVEPQKRVATTQFVFHLVDSMIHRHILETDVAETDEVLAHLLSNIVVKHIDSIAK